MKSIKGKNTLYFRSRLKRTVVRAKRTLIEIITFMISNITRCKETSLISSTFSVSHWLDTHQRLNIFLVVCFGEGDTHFL